jgi:hypothetical protein
MDYGLNIGLVVDNLGKHTVAQLDFTRESVFYHYHFILYIFIYMNKIYDKYNKKHLVKTS